MPIPGPSQYDLDNFSQIMLTGTWWSVKFWRLYQASDYEHREALKLAAPEHAAAFERWEISGDALKGIE